jgi:hypothetical protein
MLVDAAAPGLLVKPAVARAQLEAERVIEPVKPAVEEGEQVTVVDGGLVDPAKRTEVIDPAANKPKRYYGTVTLDATRAGRDAGRIADEVIAHLVGLMGARVTVTLEIEAEIPNGAPDHVVRTVTENGRTLRFSSQGFERE